MGHGQRRIGCSRRGKLLNSLKSEKLDIEVSGGIYRVDTGSEYRFVTFRIPNTYLKSYRRVTVTCASTRPKFDTHKAERLPMELSTLFWKRRVY